MNQDDERLAEALFPAFKAAAGGCGSMLGDEKWIALKQQLALLFYKDGHLDKNDYCESVVNDMLVYEPPTALLTNTVLQLDEETRTAYLFKVSAPPCSTKEIVTTMYYLGKEQSDEFKVYLSELSEEQADTMMDTIFAFICNSHQNGENAGSPAFLRLLGMWGDFIILALQQWDEAKNRFECFRALILCIQRDLMSAQELADRKAWRQSIFAGASDDMRVKFASLHEHVQDVLILDAVLEVASGDDKSF